MRSLINLTLLLFCVSLISGQSKCPNGESYQPCTCSNNGEGFIITCSNIPMADIKTVFTKTNTPSVYAVYLTPQSSENDIPEDILANKIATDAIKLTCPSSNYRMTVNVNAFRNTKIQTRNLEIRNCNLIGFDFGFLENFSSLTSILFGSSTGFQSSGIARLPNLPKLDGIVFYDCEGFNDWNSYPALSRGISGLIFEGNRQINDQSLNNLLSWLAPTSGKTLKTFWLYDQGVQITRVPSIVKSSFSNLSDVSYDLNSISTITAGEIRFTGSIQRLDINYADVNVIEPGAFVGNFVSAPVTLTQNKLTRFESGVFQSMLEQMSATPYGYLDVRGNPFDCDSDPCHMAWLIRDNPILLQHVRNAFCTSRVAFQQLNPADYSHCPIIDTTTKPTQRPTTVTSGMTTVTRTPTTVAQSSTTVTQIQTTTQLLTTTTSIPDFNCPEDFGTYPICFDCCSHYYYLCFDGIPQIKECPLGSPDLVFNPAIGVCDFPDNVPECSSPSPTTTDPSCIETTTTKPDSTYSTTSTVIPPSTTLMPEVPTNFYCPTQYGFYPVCDSCCSDYYYKCIAYYAYTSLCSSEPDASSDPIFNPSTRACDDRKNVNGCQ